jgi:hypothetical protein
MTTKRPTYSCLPSTHSTVRLFAPHIDTATFLGIHQSATSPLINISHPFFHNAALSMLLTGLEGDSLKQLETVMHTTKQNLLDHVSSLSSFDPTTVSASSVWISDKLELLQSYVDTLKGWFGADANLVDFAASNETRNRINSWVVRNHSVARRNVDSQSARRIFDTDVIFQFRPLTQTERLRTCSLSTPSAT